MIAQSTVPSVCVRIAGHSIKAVGTIRDEMRAGPETLLADYLLAGGVA